MEVSYDWVFRNHEVEELERFLDIVQYHPCHVGKEVSNSNTEAKQFTYGELEFASFAETFYNIENNYGGIPEGTFYDLGSGTGKGCLAAALLHPSFEECIGLELLGGLYDVST